MNDTPSETTGFSPPRHWIGPEELSESYWSDPATVEKRSQEFHDKPIETIAMIERMDKLGVARRDFLTLMGASMAMAATACARRPVTKIIPYVVRPEEVVPGVANFYASTDPETGYGLLVKTREGRPIKLEGNPDHPINRGKLDSRRQAAILSLYDPERLQEPGARARGAALRKLSPEEFDTQVAGKLKTSARVRLLTSSLVSDTSKRLVGDFLKAFPNGMHVEYEALALEDVHAGQAEAYGTAVMPVYRFDRADVVVSFGADFLHTWGPSVEHAFDWSKRRKLASENAKHAPLSKLFMVEPIMSMTGANADERFPVRAGDEFKVALAVANELILVQKHTRFAGDGAVAKALGSYGVAAVAESTGVPADKIRAMATALWEARGKGIVVGGGFASQTSNSPALHAAINLLNSALDNEGATIDGSVDVLPRASGHTGLVRLIAEMNAGQVDTLIVDRVNPSYTVSKAFGFDAALAQVKNVIVLADRDHETALNADLVAPSSHFLESWGDAHPRKSVWSLQQPTVSPIFSSRSLEEYLLAWARTGKFAVTGLAAKIVGKEVAPATLFPPAGYPAAAVTPEQKALATSGSGYSDWHGYLIGNWRETLFPQHGAGRTFESFWDETLALGVINTVKDRTSARGNARTFRSPALSQVPAHSTADPDTITFAIYVKGSIGDGSMANNAWLQELPDPVSTVTWDNYLNVSPRIAALFDVKTHDVMEVTLGAEKFELPVYVQPGHHAMTVSVALGYGRRAAGKVGNGVGVDVSGYVQNQNGRAVYSGQTVSLRKTGRYYRLAETQWHNASENRPIINDITIDEFRKDPASANHTDPHLRMATVPSMWPKHNYPGYRWGMAIDLQSCIGCGACAIACQAENNIPTVGRNNVRVSREMHWIRIDRYYSGSAENPNVLFQPMLCQHCENAPCETVCPVLATVHDDEGTNNMAYNRCVGTRYCQNNCPYKVRRFNFFDHWKSYDSTMNLAWNPDVTVRSRGIMEKCSFCIQRINGAKENAKLAKRKLVDGEFQTACQQTCPSNAIVFGDINDPTTQVSKLKLQDHSFRVLEVLNTRPAVSYLTKVRNQSKAPHGEGAEHGHT